MIQYSIADDTKVYSIPAFPSFKLPDNFEQFILRPIFSTTPRIKFIISWNEDTVLQNIALLYKYSIIVIYIFYFIK